MRYHNPIIPGFHPDPSICRVGNDYYLVTSSFEYFPGVPIFHSHDLVNWRQMGHVLTRPSQLPLAGAGPSDGIWAPSIRHHNGRFYMVTTNVARWPKWSTRNCYVTAEDPGGEWSEPVFLDEGGIDPDLFFDDDGSATFVRNGAGGIWGGPVDLDAGRLTGAMQLLWSGTGGPYAEAPHLYKVRGRYYLVIAEGGTGYGHCVTVARGDSPLGPFEPCPRNPILTHRHRHHPIQCTGHADLFEAEDSTWWAVFLGVRTIAIGRPFQVLGRETFLAPVTWTEDGWPLINAGEAIELEMEGPALRSSIAASASADSSDFPALRSSIAASASADSSDFPAMRSSIAASASADSSDFPALRSSIAASASADSSDFPAMRSSIAASASADSSDFPAMREHLWMAAPARDEFDALRLSHRFNHLRNPDPHAYSLSERPSWLRLRGAAATLDDPAAPTFAGIRQTEMGMRVRTLVDFTPGREGEEAGLTIYMNPRHHWEIALVRGAGGEREVIVRGRVGDLQSVVFREATGTAPIVLGVDATPETYTFVVGKARGSEPPRAVASVGTVYLSSDLANSFTGVYFGLYATGAGAPSTAAADFDYLEAVTT
jgi:beta-xylosidase